MSGKYSDLSSMGVGTNILGYANDKIDREVIKSIKLLTYHLLILLRKFY